MKNSFLVILMICLLACKKEDPSPSPTPSLTTPVTDSFIGSYNKNNSDGSVAHLTITDATNFSVSFTVASSTYPVASGTYSKTSSHITFTHGTGGSCPGEPGSYTYTLSSSNLAFTVVSDACVYTNGTPRPDFVQGNWVKQ